MQELQQGENTVVSAAHPTIRFRWSAAQGRGVEADVSAYLLDGSGKVRGDHDMVFYNQPVGGDGAVRFVPGQQGRFDIDLESVPQAIERIALCLTIDEANSKGHTLALLDDAEIILADGEARLLAFRPQLGQATEAAMIMAELYRREGFWKFRAVGQGFNGGLAPLARSLGIDVAEEPPAPAPVIDVAPRYEKINLEPGHVIRLEAVAGLGEITINLIWSHGRRSVDGGGAMDLDLGCLVEMHNGRKGAIQAIGAMLGSFDEAPYVLLSRDDRTGGGGEILRINGAGWREIKRIAVFANVYDGTPDWQAANPLMLISAPGQPPLQIQITEGRNDRRICGIALLENDGGALVVSCALEYFADQHELDERFTWGLRWQPGSKA